MIDWSKKLSFQAKAEILGALLHELVWHTPKMMKSITKKRRIAIRRALADCSIEAEELTKKDYRDMTKYLKLINE